MKSPTLIPVLPLAVGAVCAAGLAALAGVALTPRSRESSAAPSPAVTQPSGVERSQSDREWVDAADALQAAEHSSLAPTPALPAENHAPASGERSPSPQVAYSLAAVREVEASAQTIRRLIEPETEEAALLARLVDLVRSRRSDEPTGGGSNGRAEPATALTAQERIPQLEAAYPSPAARQELLLLLSDPDPKARIMALRALSRWSDSEADLIALLEREQDACVRRAAVAALSGRGGERALAVLASWTRRDDLPRPERDAAIRGTQRLARRLGEPVPALPLTRRQEMRSAAPAAAPRRDSAGRSAQRRERLSRAR